MEANPLDPLLLGQEFVQCRFIALCTDLRIADPERRTSPDLKLSNRGTCAERQTYTVFDSVAEPRTTSKHASFDVDRASRRNVPRLAGGK